MILFHDLLVLLMIVFFNVFCNLLKIIVVCFNSFNKDDFLPRIQDCLYFGKRRFELS